MFDKRANGLLVGKQLPSPMHGLKTALPTLRKRNGVNKVIDQPTTHCTFSIDLAHPWYWQRGSTIYEKFMVVIFVINLTKIYYYRNDVNRFLVNQLVYVNIDAIFFYPYHMRKLPSPSIPSPYRQSQLYNEFMALFLFVQIFLDLHIALTSTRIR